MMFGQPLKGPMRVRDHPLYRRWCFMRNVCNNPRHADYATYGARGISVDPAFAEFWDFVDLIESKLGYPQDFDYRWKLARKDQAGDYTMRNLKWDQAAEVGRRCDKAFKMTYKGKTKSLKEWSEQTGINFHTLLSRVNRGWQPAECLGYRPGPRERKSQKKKL
jgi:hypothetical protein